MTLLHSSHLDHKTALTALRSSAASYFKERQIRGFFPASEVIQFIERDNIEVVISRLHDHPLIVAFRGTDEGQDVCRDLRFSFARGPLGGEVHSGFLSAWRSVRDEVKEQISNHRLMSPDVVFTGHSLGGAIATLAHAQARAWGVVTTCYTFGAPRVGDRDFAREYERQRLGELHYRMVMEGDPVPGLPPAWLGFRHVGTEVYATGKGVLAVPPGNFGRFFRTIGRMVRRERDHSITAYQEALTASKNGGEPQ